MIKILSLDDIDLTYIVFNTNYFTVKLTIVISCHSLETNQYLDLYKIFERLFNLMIKISYKFQTK